MDFILDLFRYNNIPDEISYKIIYEYSGIIHPLSIIITHELMDSVKYYRFNHVFSNEVTYSVSEANLYNPRTSYYNGRNYSYFLHRDYDEYDTQYPEQRDLNPTYIYSNWKLFEYDGATKYWNGSTHTYPKELMSNGEGVPVACMGPDDETPTDRDRRYTEYRKNTCSWSIHLPTGCHCTETGALCLKRENELYRSGYFDDEYVHEPNNSDSD